jgi:glycosyltransferase involved in cell wall biosynthesis
MGSQIIIYHESIHLPIVMKRLQILVIPGFRIFPIDSGGAHMQLTYLDKQQYDHDIDLLLTPENIDASSLSAFKERFPKLGVIVSGFDNPGKASKPIAFLKKQWRKWSGKDLSYRLGKSRQLNGFLINNPKMVDDIAAIASAKTYDIIQVEQIKNLGLVTVLNSKAKTIFVHHEIYFSRVRQDMKSLSYSDTYSTYMASIAEGVELFWLKQYDGIISFNADDTGLLEEKGIEVPQRVAQPFALFDEELNKIYLPEATPQLAFVGGETHYPNKEGLLWFLDEVWPLLIKAAPDVKLKITGNWTEATQNKYSSEAVIFTGFVDNLDEILKTAILVVPIRIGSGVRVKVFTSFAKGLPMVSTQLGASGISDLMHGINIMLADDPNSFAESTIRLLLDEQLRKNMSEQSFALARKQFGEGGFVDERNTFYHELLSQKK